MLFIQALLVCCKVGACELPDEVGEPAVGICVVGIKNPVVEAAHHFQKNIEQQRHQGIEPVHEQRGHTVH